MISLEIINSFIRFQKASLLFVCHCRHFFFCSCGVSGFRRPQLFPVLRRSPVQVPVLFFLCCARSPDSPRGAAHSIPLCRAPVSDGCPVFFSRFRKPAALRFPSAPDFWQGAVPSAPDPGRGAAPSAPDPERGAAPFWVFRSRRSSAHYG